MKTKITFKELTKVLEESIVELIGGENGFIKRTENLIKKHKQKVHFIPLKYRVLSGFLQSLNIKFGNFIEELLPKLITITEKNIEIVKAYSNRKDIRLSLDTECEQKIDAYINHPPKDVDKSFQKLVDDILILQNNKKSGNFRSETMDVDLLIEKDKTYYYIEIKYNDDHDTGKFKDINRKFIKTFAGLVHELNISDKDKIVPLLYYFNDRIRYQDVYLKEGVNVFRGRNLFEKLQFSISYDDIENILYTISRKLENKFDELKTKIFKRVNNNSFQK